jgi:anti-sigma factor RsiW
MYCNETRRLLEAAVDRELDLVRQVAVEEHLRTCSDCARLAEKLRARRAALQENLPRFAAPPALREKIRQSIGASAASPAPATRANIVFPDWSIGAWAAALVVALTLGFTWGGARARRDLLVDDAIADHVRSLQAGHLMDVASTDQHTVKPWFAGKIDFSPPVVDLAAAGFPLAGGRLERLDGHPAAALVFHRRQHAINLFVWSAAPAAGERQFAARGFNLVAWSQADLNFLAVSEIPAAELADFATAYRNAVH